MTERLGFDSEPRHCDLFLLYATRRRKALGPFCLLTNGNAVVLPGEDGRSVNLNRKRSVLRLIIVLIRGNNLAVTIC